MPVYGSDCRGVFVWESSDFGIFYCFFVLGSEGRGEGKKRKKKERRKKKKKKKEEEEECQIKN